MKQKTKMLLSLLLVFSLVTGISVNQVSAAKKPKLNKKKVTVEVGKKKTITVKNTKKKAKWSIKKGKKYIKITKKKKSSVTIKGKKAGKAVVVAKVGKKKLSCKVTVKNKNKDGKQPINTSKPNKTPGSGITQKPIITVKTPTPPADTAQPGSTYVPGDTTTTPPADTAQPGSTYVPEPVKNIVIDLSKYKTTFTSSPAKIDFSDQIESRFDLKLFSSLKVTYSLEFEDNDTSDYVQGKIGVAQDSTTLDGYANGVAYTYGMTATGNTATVSLVGETIAGTVMGINIQPMNATYAWPKKLTSVTITGIEFVAKSGAVYPDPNAPVDPTPTPGPTYAPEEFSYEGTDISWIDTSKPMVAFTFDDGPEGTASTSKSMKIQAALKKYNAHATFFYIGSRINASGKEEIKQAKENGFEVGNHSYEWSNMSSMGEKSVKESVEKTNALLKEATGYSNFLFRAPELAVSSTMKAYIKAPFINSSIDSKDWNKATTQEIIENVKKAKDGDIVLMHETEANTVEAIDTLLDYFINEQGYQVVSVSELFKAKNKTLMTGTEYSRC